MHLWFLQVVLRKRHEESPHLFSGTHSEHLSIHFTIQLLTPPAVACSTCDFYLFSCKLQPPFTLSLKFLWQIQALGKHADTEGHVRTLER